MKYLVMESEPGYAIVLDEEGRRKAERSILNMINIK